MYRAPTKLARGGRRRGPPLPKNTRSFATLRMTNWDERDVEAVGGVKPSLHWECSGGVIAG